MQVKFDSKTSNQSGWRRVSSHKHAILYNTFVCGHFPCNLKIFLLIILTNLPYTSSHHYPRANAHRHHNNNNKIASHPHSINPIQLNRYQHNTTGTWQLWWWGFNNQKDHFNRSYFKLCNPKIHNRENTLRSFRPGASGSGPGLIHTLLLSHGWSWQCMVFWGQLISFTQYIWCWGSFLFSPMPSNRFFMRKL